MRNTNKKGFTIVELVIVVAVIAILAAVLIPTFSNLIKKANQSSDIQATRQMNTALAIAGELADIDAVIDALAEAGFNSKEALIPVSAGYTFYWYETAKQIVLENDNGEVIFPEGVSKEEGVSLESSVKYIDVEANDSNSLIAAVTNGNKDIKLSSDINLSSSLTALAGSEITLDLGGNTLSAGMADATKHQYALNVYGTVTLTNGTVDAREIQIYAGGKLVIGEGVTINAIDDNGGACLWVYEGAEVVVNGGTFTAMNGVKWSNGSDIRYNPGVINNSGKVTINGGTFKSAETICYLVQNSGEMVINGGTFEGTHGVVANSAGTTTINGGSFTLKPYADGSFDGHVVYTSGGNVVISENSTATFGGHDSIFCENGGTITDNR